MTKQERHEAIRARCARAIADMYHNATPIYPRLNDEDGERFNAWFEDAAQFEIEYIKDGGGYASLTPAGYRKTLEAPCNAGRYKSEAARRYYVRKGIREMIEERDRYTMWEWIGRFGSLYQWGRGGRTLAPLEVVKEQGGSRFSMRESWPEDRTIAEVVEAIRIFESFNAYVESWCKSVPEQWAEVERERIRDEAWARNKQRARKAAATRAINANYRGL